MSVFPSSTRPSRPLLEAYLRTNYWVDHPAGSFAIRIGHKCPQIDSCSWAYVTACNPRSCQLSKAENEKRTAELQRSLEQAGYTFFPGQSVGWDGDWPAEASFLIVDISPAEARRIAESFDQWAIVVGGRDQPAQLLWLGAGDSAVAE